ncbi:MAG: tetratricopeptide repeat protein [Deltaproteobacteria bacterium]|nr:tetratricopeptide repeat protein [Deltaproteobacteria bacterium]
MSRKNKRKKKKPKIGFIKAINRASPPKAHQIDIELDKAIQYHESGQLKKAQKVHKKILKINSTHSLSLNLLGLIALQTGKAGKAVHLISKAIQHDPGNPVYYNDLGNAFRDQGKLNEAISCYKKATELKPTPEDLIGAYYNLGNVYRDKGELKEAISFFQQAVQLKPDPTLLADLYNNMATVFKDQELLNESISCCQKALQLNPNSGGTWNNLGNAFQKLGLLDKALSCYKKALEQRSYYGEAYYNIGSAFLRQGMLDKALSSYEKALKQKTHFPEAHNDMGVVFQNQGKSAQAICCFEKALEQKPDHGVAFGNLVYQLRLVCEWKRLKGFDTKLDMLNERALQEKVTAPELPLSNIVRHPDPAVNFEVAQSWSLDINRRMSNLGIGFPFDDRKAKKGKVVIGYLSSDFRDHPVAHLMISLIGLHNRDEFEIFCYSYGRDDGSYYSKRIREDCNKFVDLCDMSYVDAAKCIYNDKVDILVDLNGYTRDNRLEICALRPAPVQVVYLGFLGSTGANFFDYIITDKIVTPEDHATYYSENFIYLPHCYQVNAWNQTIADNDSEKMDYGLRKGSFVFCSFNAPYKIEPVMFEVWMRILQRVPNGVLWLSVMNKIVKKNLRAEAEGKGVSSERLVFAKRMPLDEHLARLAFADLALDTRIHNGGATTSNALWAGIPVISLQGNHFVSRMSASLLTAVGLPELITRTLDEYEKVAVHLAHNQGELQTLRKKLEINRLSEPLFDTPRFTRNLEKAYTQMWEIFVAGGPPQQIDVVEEDSDTGTL